MSEAYAKVGKMKGRGKVVVDMEKFGELCVDWVLSFRRCYEWCRPEDYEAI